LLLRHRGSFSSRKSGTNRWLTTAPRSSSVVTNWHAFSARELSALRLHRPSAIFIRAFSSDTGEKKAKGETGDVDDDETSKEIVMTPGEKVVAASRLGMWLGIGAFAAVCAYYIGKELFPTYVTESELPSFDAHASCTHICLSASVLSRRKMSPNSVFHRSFEVVRNHPDVLRLLGEPVKAYGRDHGGHREGRRNFIEHTEYQDKTDGSKRTRVRYNLEGRFGTAFCFAEVSSTLPSDEFVYVLVQDKSTGRVLTIVDNRSAMTASRLAGQNQAAAGAMSQLLTGSSQNNSK
jgi:import inner membrane translocase subunit TIM21